MYAERWGGGYYYSPGMLSYVKNGGSISLYEKLSF